MVIVQLPAIACKKSNIWPHQPIVGSPEQRTPLQDGVETW